MVQEARGGRGGAEGGAPEEAHRDGVAMWREEEGADGGVVEGVGEKQQRPGGQGGQGVDPQSRAQAPVLGVVHAA